ncbi:metal-sensitive transcriptional regulator [Desulfitobacterium dichloroeliminans]|uniref:metal-sensitive transcriptional regulator n=1 Tax=Desulfitobacterium dichloroeliminans TaxID=233055 RepID=UPI0002498F37|nr:metal-sensitive transcriptional regulator [Desulfitobacterium dichloroeliminans]
MQKNYEKEKILRRIKIIRGQLSAIERMIEEEKTPEEILPPANGCSFRDSSCFSSGNSGLCTK